MPKKKPWPIVAVTICLALSLSACSSEPVKQAYRDSSDWLNDIPDAPPPDAWRLSKRIDAEDVPYPNLGDVPGRPALTPETDEAGRQILEFERTAAGTALKTNPQARASAADLGAPPPAGVSPLAIPPPQ